MRGVRFMLEKLFHLTENKTTVRTEIIAGLTTFLAMAYILAVNPSILSAAGMDVASVFLATACRKHHHGSCGKLSGCACCRHGS